MKDINRVTGYVRSGCSPVGMKKQYVTRIHESAKEQEAIFVSAGRLGQQMELSPVSLAEIAGAAETYQKDAEIRAANAGAAESQQNEPSAAESQRVVVCPKCGETIWL